VFFSAGGGTHTTERCPPTRIRFGQRFGHARQLLRGRDLPVFVLLMFVESLCPELVAPGEKLVRIEPRADWNAPEATLERLHRGVRQILSRADKQRRSRRALPLRGERAAGRIIVAASIAARRSAQSARRRPMSLHE
jgi:hypothetical protein